MANFIVLKTDKDKPEVEYRNATIIKVHDDENFYDIKFLSGKIETFVENVSAFSFNSGEYVAVLISGTEDRKVYKIIGKGRKVGETEEITVVRV